MARSDWYRKTSWTADDQADFFTRLGKARPHNRSQYLHIQASHLMEAGGRQNLLDALSLLDLAIGTYPNPVHLETDYFLKAKCYEALGRPADAVAAYREACEAGKNDLSIRTQAPLDYAYFAVSHRQADLYDEVLAVLGDVIEPLLLFPVHRYRFAASLALIYDQYRQKEVAKKFSREALDAVTQMESGLGFLLGTSLVTRQDKDVVKRLKKI